MDQKMKGSKTEQIVKKEERKKRKDGRREE